MNQTQEQVISPRLHVKRASLGDAPRLAGLLRTREGEQLTGAQLSDCIEHGGALYFEDEHGPVSVLAWQESPAGWDLLPAGLREDQDDDGHERWLLTQVEALAIRLNVPRLSLEPLEGTDPGWYRRMGYEQESTRSPRLVRKVGGTWQYRQAAGA